jgi:H/ACA ribonucleoprotein complex subunit 2
LLVGCIIGCIIAIVIKNRKSDAEVEEKTLTGDYQTRLFVSPIATPMSDDKLTKKVLKLVKNGMKSKLVKRGIKETVKAVRKG